MKRCAIAFAAGFASLVALSCGNLKLGIPVGDRIVDHVDANVDGITAARTEAARQKSRIVYWHTSHGSQLISGIDGMDAFYGSNGWYILRGENGLAIDEQSPDVGAFDSDSVANSATLFQAAVRTYLAGHADTNVVMASWCGQIGYGTTTEADIDSYLARISELEDEYPGVVFVYMTGHSDGGGLEGQVNRYNQIIRDYCVANDKWLYDFYDIECYDPDGQYFGDKNVTDNCDYDGGNWATEWQGAHPGEWWSCSSAHSQPLNANQKAKAAWQLWCAIADGM
jgi:hypothetical protein